MSRSYLAGATLVRVWLIAILMIIVAQVISAALYPRSWEFLWVLPVAGRGPVTMLRAVLSVWLGLWRHRPLEALSLTVLSLAVLFTLGWLVLWFVRAAHHAYTGAQAI